MSTEKSHERIYWSTAEAAAYISVAENTLWTWVTKNKKRRTRKFKAPSPPFIRLGKFIRFPIEQFKEWAKNPNSVSERQP